MAQGEAILRFYAELNDLLPARRRREKEHLFPFIGRNTVKDAIESFDIPHTQVDLILVNGEPVTFDYLLNPGDRVAVYPVFESMNIAGVTPLRPLPLRHTAFILDVHLGKLARLMRTAGLDTLYRNDYEDAEIIRIALDEHRIILTRDKGILKHRIVTHGHWLYATDPREQFIEVVRRFDLHERLEPFSRCTWCNAPLVPVEKKEIEHLLEKRTRENHTVFMQCPVCHRIYWQGCHYEKMKKRLKAMIDEAIR
jgi:uncharacterized protein with PIN domain